MLRRRPPCQETLQKIRRQTKEYIALGNWDAAAKELQPALRGGTKDPSTIVLYAQVLRGMKHYDKALKLLTELLGRSPDHLRALQEKGKVLLEKGDVEQALTCLRETVAVTRDEESVIDLSSALYVNGHIEEAWSYLEDRALESCNGRLLALAGDCHFYWKNYPLAVSFYQQAEHYGWINHRTLSRTGHSLCKAGEFLEAEQYFREILEYDSGDVFATLGLGTCLERRGLFHRALIVYQSGEAWDKGDPFILRQAGICAVYTAKYDYAELYLSEAIQHGARSPQAMAFYGHTLECQKRWQDAEEVYFKLIEEYPDHVAGYRALAWLYGVGLSRFISAEQGVAIAERAVQALPDAASWELLSACEARAGNYLRAHDIQEHLWSQTTDKLTRQRRRLAMKTLRKNLPLDEHHVSRSLVA